MSILNNIFQKIVSSAQSMFSNKAEADAVQGTSPQGSLVSQGSSTPQGSSASQVERGSVTSQAAPQPTPGAATSSGQGSAPVNNRISDIDVEATLDSLARKSGQMLNWRSSIVDLLKLLDMDSSMQARKELAQELNFKGDTNDSASMNIWLHKQVMNKLAENGGKIPADLKD